MEQVQEIRLETVVRADKIEAVVRALRRSHPYETPAYDVFRHYDMERRFGIGRIGNLERPMQLEDLLARLKQATGVRAIGIVGPQNKRLARAAVCAGSCGRTIQSVIDQGADLYVTGELKHHLALVAREAGLTCLCLGHSVSERFAVKNWSRQLKKTLPGVKIHLSMKDSDPFEWKIV